MLNINKNGMKLGMGVLIDQYKVRYPNSQCEQGIPVALMTSYWNPHWFDTNHWLFAIIDQSSTIITSAVQFAFVSLFLLIIYHTHRREFHTFLHSVNPRIMNIQIRPVWTRIRNRIFAIYYSFYSSIELLQKFKRINLTNTNNVHNWRSGDLWNPKDKNDLTDYHYDTDFRNQLQFYLFIYWVQLRNINLNY